MDDLLFLAHRIPYPPNKGDKIRSWHMLEYLVSRYRVHLGCFIDDPEDWAHTAHLDALCASTRYVDLPSWRGQLRSIGAFLRNEALSVAYYRDREFLNWVEHTVLDVKPAAALCFSSQMALALPALKTAGTRVVMDFVDVDSDKWAQYASKKSGPLKALYGREAARLAEYEASVAAQVDACLFVSEQEAKLFKERVPQAANLTYALSNGVDAEVFSPGRDFPNPFPQGQKTVIFTGAMDYWPNADAVVWFADHVWQKVQQDCPDAAFYIIGSKPTADVQALASRPGVTVTGAVDDTKDYLAHAVCAVAPLRIARGIQNKVLEAMAMALPVVASPQAAEGLDRVTARELTVVDAPDAMAEAVVAALSGAGLSNGVAARQRVIDDYGWEANLSVLDRLLTP